MSDPYKNLREKADRQIHGSKNMKKIYTNTPYLHEAIAQIKIEEQIEEPFQNLIIVNYDCESGGNYVVEYEVVITNPLEVEYPEVDQALDNLGL